MITASLLSGCSNGARLYSLERDKQGRAAAEAWSKVDLRSQIEVPRQNLAKTLTEQIAIEEEVWMKRQGIQAGKMASDWTVARFRAQAGQGLQRVLGGALAPEGAASAARSYLVAAKALDTAFSKRDGRAAEIAILGLAPPSCAIALDKDKLATYTMFKHRSIAGDPRALALRVDALVGACDQIRISQSTAAAAAQTNPPGELSKALAVLHDEEAALESDKAAADLLLISLKAAQAEYAAAEKEIEGNPRKSREKVDEALGKLKILVGKLPRSGNPDSADDIVANPDSIIATQLFSQERLDSINRFLATYDDVVHGKGSAIGSNRLAVALALFPDLQKQSQKALADAERPNLMPLILHKNIEQTKLDTANRDVQRRQTLLGLRRQIVTSLEDQLEAYMGAFEASLQVPAQTRSASGAPIDVKWADALQPFEETAGTSVLDVRKSQKIAAWRASSRFLEAEGRMRADVGQNYYRIYALQNEGVLLHAESSILQWKGLIDPSIELLAQWGTSGIDSKDIIQLFNSVMLFGIAAGVN